MQIAPIKPNNINENFNSDNINFGRRRKKRPFRPYNAFEGNRYAVYHSYEDYREGKAPKWVKGYNRNTGETGKNWKKVRPFWDGSQEFNIEYLLFALAPIALVIATYLGFVSGENRKRNDIIDKKYKALIEEPYINYKKNEALTKDPYIIYRDPHSIEGLNEITFFEAKSVIRLREVTHELANTINFSKNASTLEKYLQQQIKEAQGKDSAEGILVTKDEISVIKYNFKNKKKELRGKAVDGYKSFETTKLGAPISEAIKFQNIKNYSKNLLANAKLPNSNPIFNTKNLQKMIKR